MIHQRPENYAELAEHLQREVDDELARRTGQGRTRLLIAAIWLAASIGGAWAFSKIL